jgi:rare lipoprotein A
MAVLSSGALVRSAALAGVCACAAACSSVSGPQTGQPYRAANLRPYSVNGQVYRPQVYRRYEEQGLASWYSYPKGQRRTATGEPFDGSRLTAAHKTLPLPCVVEVTNLENGRKVRVRVNDRGPFVPGRIIDLSPAAAERLGFQREGVARVKVKLLGQAVAESEEIRLAQAAPQDGAEHAGALQPADPGLY